MHISWRTGIPGRETKSLEVFASALTRFEGLAKQGRIDGHQEFFSITGDNGGFMIVTGQLEELLKIAGEPETRALNTRAAAIVRDFRVEIYAGGTDQSVQELMGDYTSRLGELGYM
jgi:hypothetical protein